MKTDLLGQGYTKEESKQLYEALEKILECYLSCDRLEQPVTLSGCGHSFSSAYASQLQDPKCPLCEKAINDKNKFQKNPSLSALTSALTDPPDIEKLFNTYNENYKNLLTNDVVSKNVFQFLDITLKILKSDEPALLDLIASDKRILEVKIPHVKMTKRVALRALSKDYAIENIPENLWKTDREILTVALLKNFKHKPLMLFALDCLPEIALSVLQEKSPDLKNDKEIILKALEKSDNAIYYFTVDQLMRDKDIFNLALPQIQKNIPTLIAVLNKDITNLKLISPDVINDKAFQKAAKERVKEKIFIDWMKGNSNDKEGLLLVLKINGLLLEHISSEMKQDPEFFCTAVKNNPEAILFGINEWETWRTANKAVALFREHFYPLITDPHNVIHRNSRTFICIVMLKSVQINGKVPLYLASPELQQDDVIIAFACQIAGELVSVIPENKWSESGFLEKIIKSNPINIGVIVEVMNRDGLLLQYFRSSVNLHKTEMSIPIAAVKNNPDAIQYVDKEVLAKADFWKAITPLIQGVDMKYRNSTLLMDEWKKRQSFPVSMLPSWLIPKTSLPQVRASSEQGNIKGEVQKKEEQKKVFF